MFKKIIFSSAIVVASVVTNVFGVSAADMKIGIFNERAVLAKAPQLELIEAKLQKQFADRLDELKVLREKGLKMQEKAKRDVVTMTEAEKIKLDRELTDLSTSLQTKNKNLQEDFQRAKQEELNKIRVKIQKIVTKIANDEKYDIILRIESVVYRAETIDISNKVITVLTNPAG